MAVVATWFNQDLLDAVKVHYIDGNVFSGDSIGNLIGVNVYSNGSPAQISGSVSGNIIRSDGATVSVAGGYQYNRAYITLPAAAYAVPGPISIVIKVTGGGSITTVCAAVANVYQSSTDTIVDPGTIIPSVQALISAINEAVASIPADYSDLWATLAPNYSTSGTYDIGDYCTYNGAMYRCKFPIITSESWASSHWEQVNISGRLIDLQEQAQKMQIDLLANVAWEVGAYAYWTGEEIDTAVLYRRCKIDLPSDCGKLRYKTIASSPQANITFYDVNDNYISGTVSTANPAVWVEETVDIPIGAKKVGFSFLYNQTDIGDCKCYIDLSAERTELFNADAIVNASANTKTVSSNYMIKITDAVVGTRAKKLEFDIAPYQEGSGDPSPTNVRNITGNTQINVYHKKGSETNPTIIQNPLGQTVYYGKVDITNGTLYSEAALAVFDGSSDENWQTYGNDGFYISISGMESTSYRTKGISNWLPSVYNTSLFGIAVGIVNSVVYCFKITENIDAVTDLASWRTYLSTHNLQVVYPLATKINTTVAKKIFAFEDPVNDIWSNQSNRPFANNTLIYNAPISASVWKGKKMAAIGDSITWGFGPNNTPQYRQQLKSYAQLAADDLGMTIDNQAISGCTFAYDPDVEAELYPIVNRYNDLPDDADLIIVTGGTNDVRLGVPLGTMSDRVNTTYYGAWHIVLGGLYKKYYIDQAANVAQNKQIVVIAPIKFIDDPASTSGGNGTFYDWTTWINAIKEVAAYYSIPVLDFYNTSGMNPHLNCTVYGDEVGREGYYNKYLPDGVHPSQEGHRIMANKLIGFINSIS